VAEIQVSEYYSKILAWKNFASEYYTLSNNGVLTFETEYSLLYVLAIAFALDIKYLAISLRCSLVAILAVFLTGLFFSILSCIS